MDALNFFQDETNFIFVPAGNIIFSLGETGDVMYIVKEGEVDVMIGDKILETAGPGAFLGEISVIDGKPRSATAIAKSNCKLILIDEKRFTFLVQQNPQFSLHLMRELANRLRTMDEKVEP
jgi:CRP/FNR family cyclic AMP-dependent transcriptional regulator